MAVAPDAVVQPGLTVKPEPEPAVTLAEVPIKRLKVPSIFRTMFMELIPTRPALLNWLLPYVKGLKPIRGSINSAWQARVKVVVVGAPLLISYEPATAVPPVVGRALICITFNCGTPRPRITPSVEALNILLNG